MERKIRTYKAVNEDYELALKRGQKESTPLATLIEEFVRKYGKKATSTTGDYLEVRINLFKISAK